MNTLGAGTGENQYGLITHEGKLGLRPNVHTIHPKFYVILVIFNTI